MFAMGAAFKFIDMGATAGYITAAGFPFPLFLAWCAAILETLLVIAFLTGALFTPAALIAAIYVLFLGFAFHGPSHWAGNQAEFGAFMSHFPFAAGLLFAAVHGPGNVLAVRQGWPGKA
ncbi:MAG: DoxX family protein [Mesorhizobium sp.]|nr:MAG: DoxX family protein [Mesorhizobium sp.]